VRRAAAGLGLALLLGLVGAAPVPAASQPVLRWGADAEGGAPYVFPDPRDPTRLVGFEVDLADALARALGRRAEMVQNQWEGLIPGLERGDYDIALNGLEITPDRARAIDFTVPYYATSEQLAVRAGSPAPGSLGALRGRVVGTLRASFAQRVLERAGGIEVRSYDGQINAYQDLANGRLDAVLMDWPIALYYGQPDPRLALVGPPIEELEYGIGVRKGDTALREALDRALLAGMRSGELRRIYERWGLWNPQTEALFARLAGLPAGSSGSPAGSSAMPGGAALRAYTDAVSRSRGLGERLRRYARDLPILLREGAPMTLLVSLCGMTLAVSLGLALALANLYGPRPVAAATRAWIELVRGTPLLIQLYLVFYGLPSAGVRLSPFVAAVVGLGLNYAAYEAENYRAGIQAIPPGQTEAALSLGMSRVQALRHVVVPQALRIVIPPVTNDFISLFKDSSIVSVITLVELTKVYGELASTDYDYIGVGLLTAAIYFLMGLPFVRLARWAEARSAFDRRPPGPARRRWLGAGGRAVPRGGAAPTS
jgi:polar amino acid transport system substrate-binding protein